jgi:ABC-type phosphate transport system permease subunit
MRHFLSVVGAVIGNFALWLLITMLPVHPIILFGLVIAVGCLMLYVIVRSGQAPDNDPSTQN